MYSSGQFTITTTTAAALYNVTTIPQMILQVIKTYARTKEISTIQVIYKSK